MVRKIALIKTGNGYRIAIDHLTFDLVAIPGGKFRRSDGKEVTINPFYLSEFAVTQELFQAVTGKKPSRFEGNNRDTQNPATASPPLFHEMDDSILDKFILNPALPGFRLSTEAKWEYAAHGDFKYWFNTIEQLAGENASLLVVINHKLGHSLPFDEAGFRARFPFVNEVVRG